METAGKSEREMKLNETSDQLRIRERTDFSLFRRVPLIRLEVNQLRETYKQNNTVRIEFPQCQVRSSDYFVFDSVLTELRNGPNQVRGIAMSVLFHRLMRMPGSSVATTSAPTISVPRTAVISPTQPPPPFSPSSRSTGSSSSSSTPAAFTPGSTTTTPLTPPSVLTKNRLVEFEVERAALKLTTDERTKRESRTLQILRAELIMKGKSPHISVPFKFFSCTEVPDKINGWGRAGEIIRTAQKTRRELNEAKRQEDSTFLQQSTSNTTDRTSVPIIYYYLLTEFSDRGSLHQRLNPRSTPIEPEECRSFALQITFALHQFHELGMIHRDFHHGNITFKKNRSDWLVYYNVAMGDTDDRGALLHMFFEPFRFGQIDVVKLIDFELVHNSGLDIYRPSTAITARAPEQLLASMRLVNDRTPKYAVAKQEFGNDTFSLAIMLVDTLLRTYSPSRTIYWQVATMELPVNDEVYARLELHIQEFTQQAIELQREHRMQPWQIRVNSWITEPLLLKYIQNMVYFMGPPELSDLPFLGGAFKDELYRLLFQPMRQIVGVGFTPQLVPFLRRQQVPQEAIDMIAGVWRWNINNRTTTFDMLNSAYFAPLRVAANQTTLQFISEDNRSDRIYAVFGDEPVTQSRSRLRKRQEQERKRQATTEPIDTPVKRQRQLNYIDKSGKRMANYTDSTVVNEFEFEQASLFDSHTSNREYSAYADGLENGMHIPYISESTYQRLKDDVNIGDSIRSVYRILDEDKAKRDETIDRRMLQLNLVDRLDVPNQQKRCAHCTNPQPRNRCASCKQIYYCNTQCQRHHWNIHQFECE